MPKYRVFKPTKFKELNYDIFGFDIETVGQKNKFYMGSIYKDKDHYWTFNNKENMIEFLKRPMFKKSFVVATNLQFDFFGLFDGMVEEREFRLLFRGSHLITATTYVHNGQFSFKKKNNFQKLVFIDTLNYAKLSVDQLGKILNIPKLEKPACLGRLPKNEDERIELFKYNIRDSEISKKMFSFLIKGFNKLGASPKITIASTAMSLFRNKYLKHDYFGHDEQSLKEQFLAYYGGRCEVFKRGPVKDYNYYDFNSLYPSVMIESLPDPNSLRVTHNNDLEHIQEYEGISHVTIFCPPMQYPLLPVRHENKLIFPTGTFSGWYSHVELRKALEIGYIVLTVHKTQYYLKKCSPFREYVHTLYALRKEFKQKKSSMELVVKLLLNSLYGKFAQRYDEQDNFLHCDTLPFTILKDTNDYERLNNYMRVKTKGKPKVFSFPIWSLYITSLARLKLYDAISKYEPVYVDTDSIITKHAITESTELGGLKLEAHIKEGVFVKPKFYAFTTGKESQAKIKGVGMKITLDYFMKTLYDPTVKYDKFIKFKESLRRKLCINEIIPIIKHLSLEDDKRDWPDCFNPLILQASLPLFLKPINSKLEKHINNQVFSGVHGENQKTHDALF